MERYYTPPSSPSLSNLQLSSSSPRRNQSPRRKSNTNDSTIDHWTTLSTKLDDIITIEEAQEEINNTIITTLRTELLKELDKTAWMYNDHSYA